MDFWSDSEDEMRVDVRSLLKRRRVRRQGLHLVKRQGKPSAPPPFVEPKPPKGEEAEDEEEGEEEEEPGAEDAESGFEGESCADSCSESESSDSSSSLDSSDSSEEEGEEEEEEEEEEEDKPEKPGSPKGPPQSGPVSSSVAAGDGETATVTSTAGNPGPTDNVLAPIVSFSTLPGSSTADSVSAPVDTSLPQQQLSRVLTTLPDSTSTATSTGATSAPTETQDAEAAAQETSSSGPKLSRGTDAGIVLGCLGLLALLIAGAVFFYRRRQRAKKANVDEYPPEKGHYGGPNTGFDERGLPIRTQSNIMDEAMAAVYAAEGGDRASRGMSVAADDWGDERRYQMEPPAPVPAHLFAGTNAPAEQSANASYSKPMPPLPQENLDIYPPGQVPIGRYRVPSMAQTEITTTTESTWRTWNVNQAHAQKQKGWKERFLS